MWCNRRELSFLDTILSQNLTVVSSQTNLWEWLKPNKLIDFREIQEDMKKLGTTITDLNKKEEYRMANKPDFKIKLRSRTGWVVLASWEQQDLNKWRNTGKTWNLPTKNLTEVIPSRLSTDKWIRRPTMYSNWPNLLLKLLYWAKCFYS